ncbi:uncharacterized protein [Clytia hemisphaerica]|uniref:uncharacterized protein isoform X2 n=1 Tax=Clytia hemisphaerica TaxID=252671 RepID=UPI0034D449CC
MENGYCESEGSDSDEFSYDCDDGENYSDEINPPAVDFASKCILKFFDGVENKPGIDSFINASRKWTEIDPSDGYDRIRNWRDDTPLIAAVRNGHFEVVRRLLVLGADPTLWCRHYDQNEWASSIALRRFESFNEERDRYLQGDFPPFSSFRGEKLDPEILALDNLYRTNEFQNIIVVLRIAEQYWERASYYPFGDITWGRDKELLKCPNKPSNETEMRRKLNGVIRSLPDMRRLEPLAQAIVQFRKKKESERLLAINSSLQQLLSTDEDNTLSSDYPENGAAANTGDTPNETKT